MYPSWHGAHCDPPDATYGRELSPSVQTLAGLLAGRGYSTLGVSANPYLRKEFGLQRGFSEFRIPRPVPILSAEGWYLLRRGMRRGLSHFVDTAQFDRLFSRSEDINETLFATLDGPRLERGPFFMFANYMDTHFPYVPPAPYDRLFPGKNGAITQDDLDEMQDRVIQGADMPAADRTHCLSQYDGGIAYDDAEVGRLVDWLKLRGLYDNTLIVVASDHGEAFGEKHLVEHGNSAYQNLLHVALVIKYPHGARSGVVNAPVSLVDVAPTILNALGYPAPPQMQGRDLAAPPDGSRILFSEAFPCPARHAPDCPKDGCMQRAAFSWPDKLISSNSGRRELFDVAADPAENHSMYATSGALAKELNRELGRWIKTMPVEARQRTGVSGADLQRLKSLGYIQ
jgi:arylsulfatase